MRYAVAYGGKARITPGIAFAAFTSFNDASRFASITSQAEPGILFGVYDDGNLQETYQTTEDGK